MTEEQQLLLAYYADDFTGSTAVMEALALGGVPTVVLLQAPQADVLERYPGIRAVGVAGVSRSLSAPALEAELGPAFTALAKLPARLIHYKICSTFDSSPEVGSIGRAIELGQAAFAEPLAPVLAGAPGLGRYCVFGNLFAHACADGPIYRLDRHPAMRTHPVTPMTESDLSLHLGRQTRLRIEVLDYLKLKQWNGTTAQHISDMRDAGVRILLLDVTSAGDLPAIGRLFWERGARFVVGSSGVEEALVAHWRGSGLVAASAPPADISPVDRVVVVSGSCAPMTADQIAYALARGFGEVAVQAEDWLAPRGPGVQVALARMLELLRAGKSVVVHTARGPSDRRVSSPRAGTGSLEQSRQRSEQLGSLLAMYLRAGVREGVRRVAVAGGDTSGYVARALGIEALSFVGPLAPGAPLCRAHAGGDAADLDGLELTFKGGQMGEPDFFHRLREGSQP